MKHESMLLRIVSSFGRLLNEWRTFGFGKTLEIFDWTWTEFIIQRDIWLHTQYQCSYRVRLVGFGEVRFFPSCCFCFVLLLLLDNIRSSSRLFVCVCVVWLSYFEHWLLLSFILFYALFFSVFFFIPLPSKWIDSMVWGNIQNWCSFERWDAQTRRRILYKKMKDFGIERRAFYAVSFLIFFSFSTFFVLLGGANDGGHDGS